MFMYMIYLLQYHPLPPPISFSAHTFFMSKAKYGKKVMKAIVKHRTCGTCKWWQRNGPGQPVRQHRCVNNHSGSAR